MSAIEPPAQPTLTESHSIPRLVCSRTPMSGQSPAPPRWPLERVLFALAGTMTLLAAILGAVVSKWFLLLAVLVGVNQWAYVLLGACPASIVLRRAWRLNSAIYPNPDDDHEHGPRPTARQEVTV